MHARVGPPLIADLRSSQFGMQTINGIAKPVFRAFELLRDAGNFTLQVHIVDPTADGTVAAFATVAHQDCDAKERLESLKIFISNYNTIGPGLPSNDAVVKLTRW